MTYKVYIDSGKENLVEKMFESRKAIREIADDEWDKAVKDFGDVPLKLTLCEMIGEVRVYSRERGNA